MRIRTTIATATALGALIAAIAVMPASAASTSTITDPKGDVSTVTLDATTGAITSTAADFPAVDIRKVIAKRTASRLIVTVKATLLKKSALDTVSVLVRTSATTNAKYLITYSFKSPGLVVVTSSTGIKFAKKGITAHTKPGPYGTLTISIDDKWIGHAKKVSVAALLQHLEVATGTISDSDVTGVLNVKSNKGITWTKFISAK